MKIRVLTSILVLLLTGGTQGICQQAPLRAGIDGTFAPHAMPTIDGRLEGFNVDLVEELGKQLGTKIQLDSVQFSGLVPGLQSGVYDFIAAPITASVERANSVLFSEPYLNADFQFVTLKETAEVKSQEELKGKTIAVNKGSAHDQWARGQAEKSGWKIESYGTSVDAVQAIVSGRASAMLTSTTFAAWMVKQNPALKLSLVLSTGNAFALPVRKDNLQLREKIDLAIECMKSAGVIARLHQKWFGIQPQDLSASMVVYPGLGVPDLPGYDPKPHEPSCR